MAMCEECMTIGVDVCSQCGCCRNCCESDFCGICGGCSECCECEDSTLDEEDDDYDDEEEDDEEG
jgi:hypothetical protein